MEERIGPRREVRVRRAHRPVGLEWLGGVGARPLPARAGREAFERVIGSLESVEAGGDLVGDNASIERAFGSVGRKAKRGTIVVLLSDLIDLPEATMDRFAALASGGRVLVVLQVLDPEETRFPFVGTVRLRALEGNTVIETDAEATRAMYLERLASFEKKWSRTLTDHGGQFLRVETTDDPALVLRSTGSAIAGRHAPRSPSSPWSLPRSSRTSSSGAVRMNARFRRRGWFRRAHPSRGDAGGSTTACSMRCARSRSRFLPSSVLPPSFTAHRSPSGVTAAPRSRCRSFSTTR